MDIEAINTEEQLEELLSEPYAEDVEAARGLSGDVLVLGAGGKMGPTLVRRIAKAFREAGNPHQVYAVSRFSQTTWQENLSAAGAVTLPADLLDESDLGGLPDCSYAVYMAGAKFGTTGNEAWTWVMNAYLPGRVAERFKSARIVAFSTGNVYSLVRVQSGGAKETDPVRPIGEYAQSCLGRERVFEYFSRKNGTPVCLLRLNYAVEPRYGVLLDIASKVYAGQPVQVSMGSVNVIWQGDANSVCLRAFSLCKSPPEILNLTGPETLSVRWLAQEFGRRWGRAPIFEGEESATALLNDASRCHRIFGPPRVPVSEVIDLVAHWVQIGGPVLGKPTHFEVRDGKF